MTIELEVGKLYKLETGQKAFCHSGPDEDGDYYFVIEGESGTFFHPKIGEPTFMPKIIAEWSEWRPISEYKPEYGAVLVDGVRTGQNSYAQSPFAVATVKDGIWSLSGSCGCNDEPINPTNFMPIPEGPEEV